jgi:glycosyltransferase involved in cell wall biosynthesis
MKLLVDCTPLGSGGGVQVAVAFLENLRQRGDITWLALAPEQMRVALPEVLSGDDRVMFIKKNRLGDIFTIRSELKRLEQVYSPSIIFTVFGPAYFCAQSPHLTGFAISEMLYEPHILMPAALWLKYLLSDAIRCRLLRQADTLVVETETVRHRLAYRLGIAAERIAVIGNSLNPLLARHAPTNLSKDGHFGLLIPSTYYPHKNLEIIPPVAQALERLDPSFHFEFRFTLDANSAPWQRIIRHAHELGVGHRIKTLGPLPLNALAEAYKAASAVFLPTLLEASTAVYPESFYFMRPLITSDLDFARELCGEAAVFVSPLEPESIAKSVHKLANSNELTNRLIAIGERQLANTYPDPDQKFQMQLDVLLHTEAGRFSHLALKP